MILRLYFLLLITAIFSSSYGQLTAVFPPVEDQKTPVKIKTKSIGTEDKSTPCGIDTLYYSRYNNTLTTPQYLNLQPTKGAGMYFAIDDTVWLHGFNFFAYATAANGFLTSQTVTCNVYYANSNKLKSGIALASGTYTINAFGFSLKQLRQEFLFSAPVQLLSDFVITVEFASNLTNRIVLASNDYNSGDGLGNNYSGVKLSTGWSNNLLIGTTPFDADFLMEPVVEYNMSPQFEPGMSSCLGNNLPFEFINTTTFATNPQFSKEFIDSTLADNFIWDYGDGFPVDTLLNGLHSYTGTIGYFVNLNATFVNWVGSTCLGDTNIFLAEGDVVADFQSSPNGLIVSFTDQSTNATSWIWDFGDQSFGSTLKNPAHVYSAYGLYGVKLKVRDQGCVDSVTFFIDLLPTGIEVLSSKELHVDFGPNPANDELTITSNLSQNEKGTWAIYSIQGQVLKNGILKASQQIGLADLVNGVYFIRFESGEKQFTRRLVIN